MKKLVIAVLISLVLSTANSIAQNINVSTPLNSVNDSFFESFGTSFGFSLAGGSGNGSRVVGLLPNGQITPNITFSQNGINSAIPSFGGFDPNVGARFGFARMSGDGSGFSLGFNFSQGSTRTSTNTTPSITLPNGGFGTFSSGQLSPFVTGVTPVVARDNAVTRGIASGQLKPYDPNRARRSRTTKTHRSTAIQESSAATGAMSVAEIKEAKLREAAARSENLNRFILLAEQAEQAEKFVAARANIRQALKQTTDPSETRMLKSWMKKLSGKR